MLQLRTLKINPQLFDELLLYTQITSYKAPKVAWKQEVEHRGHRIRNEEMLTNKSFRARHYSTTPRSHRQTHLMSLKRAKV